MKLITICGSLKFRNEMAKSAIHLELSGWNVLMPIIPTSNVVLTDKEKTVLGNAHNEKIRMSDAIFVVDVNGYIGSSTKSEIELARKLNKEIIYYSNTIKE